MSTAPLTTLHLASQCVPWARGCEPFWQHIARCRELRMVCELLPPPRC